MNRLPDIERLLGRIGDTERLTDAERAHMRSYLREYAAHLPVRSAPARTAERAFLGAFVASLLRPARFSTALALMLAVCSGGVVYAAEGTVPGDALYPVKISVNEPVRIALATSPEQKATLYMSYAERRIDEAAALAAKGALATTTELALAENFEKNAARASAEVRRENADAEDAASLSATNFAERLSAYERVLAAVQAERGAASTSTARLGMAIRTQIAMLAPEEAAPSAVAPVRAALTLAVSAKSAPAAATATSTDKLKRAANRALKNTAGVIDTAGATLGATTSAAARLRLEHAAALAAEGQELLDHNDDVGAAQAFRASISATAELDVLTHAAVTLGINAFGAPGAQAATDTMPAASTTDTLPAAEDTDSGGR